MKHLLFILTLSLPWQMVAAGAPATPQAAVAVPMLGYYYDAAAHRISPVQGIPGAALTVLLSPAPGCNGCGDLE